MLFHNARYRLWAWVQNWWTAKEPECTHWYREVSSPRVGRKEIGVSRCYWCKRLTSELYVRGKPVDEYNASLGYGPSQVCPITDHSDDPTFRPMLGSDSQRLPNGEYMFKDRGL